MTAARRLRPATVKTIRSVFARLDYGKLGPIYCDEGGEAFWRDRKGPCQALGIKLAEVLLGRLSRGGRSLYVGAGVAEIPLLAMETLELGRTVAPYNLRAEEVSLLNLACDGLPFAFKAGDARGAPGDVDHLWIVVQVVRQVGGNLGRDLVEDRPHQTTSDAKEVFHVNTLIL